MVLGNNTEVSPQVDPRATSPEPAVALTQQPPNNSATPGPNRPVPTTDDNALPGPSSSNPIERDGKCLSPTPEDLRPFPKAGPRTSVKIQRSRKLSTAILTDTPVKVEIHEQKEKRQSANEKKEAILSE
ncbi:UNVERIFIED_CONTAM: hypothetical protein FKN15_036584 [Acipenser sinensis]